MSLFAGPNSVLGNEMKLDSPKAILHELECFRQMGSVLYVAAHPDDENTELLAYLALGRNYRTAYLSLTRGDGGQNVLSADLGDKLGVARTQELLAARQLDGAHQFFSRAKDFGFSKNYQETLNVWDKNEVLSDMVRVIRQFRPDVIITRFSPSPGGTHGHHTTSAILAMEAFKLAADPNMFPEQKLEPWQAKRVLWNVSRWQKDKVANTAVFNIDAGGKDSVTGETFFDIAGASRAMHKTQGFDQFHMPGGLPRTEGFQLLDGEPPTGDIMSGVNTSWNRLEGGNEIQKGIDRIIAEFDMEKPSASVPAILELRKKLSKFDDKNPVVVEKQNELDRILAACLGLKTETTILTADVVPGEAIKMHSSATISEKAPVVVRWVEVRYPLLRKKKERGVEMRVNEPSSFDYTEILPDDTPVTQPYWLQADGTPGMFHVKEASLIGTPENKPPLIIENVFDVDGQTLVVSDEPVQVSSDAAGNQTRRRMFVIPPVSLRFVSEVAVMTPTSSRSVEVEVKAARANSKGVLYLEAPKGWKIEPKSQPFDLSDVGQEGRYTFTITAPDKSDSAKITAAAEINGMQYINQRQEISYGHLPRQIVQPPAVVKAISVDLVKVGHTVGYLPGAGDTLVENLQQMGYAVKVLDDANLSAKELEGLDAVVIGVRAFNVRANIGKAMPELLSYVENGGTLIVQYNRPDKLKTEKIAPFKLRISSDRVTDEKAQIAFLAPDNPVLNVPNKLSRADFDNWVQERGLYFPNSWDANFTPILACSDAGEPETKGALLVAKYGKGYYVYTGLSFFRQLPGAVPGAYRLFANMLSLGKTSD